MASSFDAPTFDLRRERMARGWATPPPTVHAPFTFEGAAEAAGPLLDAGGFTAVFCDDDILAGGVYLAARERGIRSRATCRSSGSTTSTSRAFWRRR